MYEFLIGKKTVKETTETEQKRCTKLGWNQQKNTKKKKKKLDPFISRQLTTNRPKNIKKTFN